MFLDISISAALAILTIFMGYLGVHLTMHPAESATARVAYKTGFAACAVLMVALVVWQGVRNAKGQAKLQGTIADLQGELSHTHIRFNTNAIVLATGDPTKFMTPMTMAKIFSVNGKAEFNVDYQNVGSTNSQRTGAAGAVIITETKPDLDSAFSALDQQFKPGWTGSEMVPQDHNFFSVGSRNLSVEDIDRLDHGRIGMYLLAIVKFSDHTGDYQQEFCGWLQLPLRTPQLVWHRCGVHDSEGKLPLLKH